MIDNSIYEYLDAVTVASGDIIKNNITYWKLDSSLLNENTLKSIFRQCIVDDPESKYAYSTIVPKSSGEGYVSYKIIGNVKLDISMAITLLENAKGLRDVLYGNVDMLTVICALLSAFYAVYSVMKQSRNVLSPFMGIVAYCLKKHGYDNEEKTVAKEELHSIIKAEFGYLLEGKDESEIYTAIDNLVELKSISESSNGTIYLVEKMYI